MTRYKKLPPRIDEFVESLGFDLYAVTEREDGGSCVVLRDGGTCENIAKVEIGKFRLRPRIGFSFTLGEKGEDDSLSLSLDSPFGRLSFASDTILRGSVEKTRDLSITVDASTDSVWVHYCLWADRDGDWRSDRSWFNQRYGCFDLLSGLGGGFEYREMTVADWREVEIPMPEGNYIAKVRLFDATWKRQKMPFSLFEKTRRRVEFKLEKGIPIPGKGENDYDCGDDAIFGQTSSADSIEQGIGSLVASCLRDRITRGSKHRWKKASDVPHAAV